MHFLIWYFLRFIALFKKHLRLANTADMEQLQLFAVSHVLGDVHVDQQVHQINCVTMPLGVFVQTSQVAGSTIVSCFFGRIG